MNAPVDDIEFLARSHHRVNALGALGSGPQRRDDLRRAIGASNATVGRLLSEFEKRTWVTRDENHYELTPLGEYIATGFFDLVERFETEHSIRDIWQWFPTDLGFTIEMFSGATVTLQNEHNPYCPNARYAELVATSKSLREMGTIPHKEENVRMVLERAIAGMDVELVFPEAVLAYMIGFDSALVTEALESGNLVLLVHNDLPGGFWVFDGHVGTCCRDEETGLSRAVIDTTTAEARAQAQSLYDTYRGEATPFDSTILVAN
jgi:predicted transcriptional regulator